MTAMKISENIINLAKKANIFDAILNTNVAWDVMPESTIMMRCHP